MIVKTYRKPGEGMTFEQKKNRVKHSFKYFFFWLINLPLFWFFCGSVYGTLSTTFSVIELLKNMENFVK